MIWELRRGDLPSLPSLHDTDDQGRTLCSLLWSFDFQQPPLVHSALALPIKKHDAGWECRLPDQTRVILAVNPWGVLPKLDLLLDQNGPRTCYLPYRGWHQGQWFDGPLIACERGEVKAYALPGSSSCLVDSAAGARADLQDWLLQRRALGWKQSLALGFRQKLAFQKEALYSIESLQPTLAHTVALLGLRLAYPQVTLVCLHRPDSDQPQWKRLCQNLNIGTWLAKKQVEQAVSLSLDDLCSAWSGPVMHEFLAELHKQIPIFPGHLLQHLKQS